MSTYDVVVVGSGPGGYSAAIRAGQYGLKTALIEKQPKLGGCCLHVGCVPTKALLHTAELWEYVKNGKEQGILVDNPRLDLPLVLERKSKIVNKHASGVSMLMKKNKVDVVQGYAKLLGRGKIEVSRDGEKRTVEAKNIIIATGSEARMLPGLEPDPNFILTNIEMLETKEAPRTLGIIGSGAVGVEFGSIFQRFGSQVTIFEMLPRARSGGGRRRLEGTGTLVQEAGHPLRNRCAKVENVEKTERSASRSRLTLSNGKTETFEFDKLLVAVGRKPNSENIGLENTKVETDAGSSRWIRSSAPASRASTPSATLWPEPRNWRTWPDGGHGGGGPHRRQAGRAHQYQPRIPGATYTEPGIGSVGLTEAQARAQGYKVKVGSSHSPATARPRSWASHGGFVKVVSMRRYGEILGVHIIGPSAYELIAKPSRRWRRRRRWRRSMATIHAHPTLYEAVGEAFNAVYGRRSMRSCQIAGSWAHRAMPRRRFAARPRAQRKQGAIPDQFLLLEHPHVHHAGPQRHAANVLAGDELLRAPGSSLHQTDRGGDVTYHGPGRSWAIPLWICASGSATWAPTCSRIEQVMIDTLADFGIAAGRVPGRHRRVGGRRKGGGHRRAYQPVGHLARLRAERDHRPRAISATSCRAASPNR
jgi:dihydrolipoamide dehydrogenase